MRCDAMRCDAMRCDAMRCEHNGSLKKEKNLVNRLKKFGYINLIKRLCQENLEIYEKFLCLRLADEKRLRSGIAFY